MPPRLLLLFLIGAAAALVLLGAAVGGWDRPSQPRLHPAGHVAHHHHRPPPPPAPRPPLPIPQPMIAPDDTLPTFPVVSLRDAVRVASGRYRGRVIGAALSRPRPEEAARLLSVAGQPVEADAWQIVHWQPEAGPRPSRMGAIAARRRGWRLVEMGSGVAGVP